MRELQSLLEDVGFECRAKDDHVIASSNRINDEIRLLCDVSPEDDRCDEIQFTIWYDGHVTYEQRGEKLLRIRIPTPLPELQELPAEIKYKICSNVNLHIKFGRFNLENIIPNVEWSCFVNGEINRKSIEQAMVHLGASYVTALITTKIAANRFKNRRGT